MAKKVKASGHVADVCNVRNSGSKGRPVTPELSPSTGDQRIMAAAERRLARPSSTEVRVKPMRPLLNGQRLPVLQFVDGMEDKISSALRPPALERWLNFVEMLAAAGFDSEQIHFLEAVYLDNIPAAQLHKWDAGWNASRVARVQKSTKARLVWLTSRSWELPAIDLQYSRGGSIERSIFGPRGGWDLATLTPADVEIEEIRRTQSRSIPIVYVQQKREITMKTFTELRDDLRLEQSKLSAVLEKSSAAMLEIAAAESDLDGLRAAVSTDEVAAVLDDKHRPDAGLAKSVAAAEKRLAEANGRRKVVDRALSKQRSTIAAIEGEICQRQHERFMSLLASPRDKYNRLIREAIAAAADIQQVAFEHRKNGIDLAMALFPPADPSHPYVGMSERVAAVNTFNAVLRAGLDLAPAA